MNRGLRSANMGTYQTWQDMKARCYNKNCHNYQNYGAFYVDEQVLECKRKEGKSHDN